MALGTVVELGLLPPGTQLTDARRRWRATVRADGSLLSECGNSGSVHKLGATLQGAPSCNGWTFWHYEADGALTPIDVVRQRHLLATQP